MSRVRIGHTPDAWALEDPRPARTRQNHYAVSAEVIGSMRPVLTYSQPQMKSGYRQKALTVVKR